MVHGSGIDGLLLQISNSFLVLIIGILHIPGSYFF